MYSFRLKVKTKVKIWPDLFCSNKSFCAPVFSDPEFRSVPYIIQPAPSPFWEQREIKHTVEMTMLKKQQDILYTSNHEAAGGIHFIETLFHSRSWEKKRTTADLSSLHSFSIYSCHKDQVTWLGLASTGETQKLLSVPENENDIYGSCEPQKWYVFFCHPNWFIVYVNELAFTKL